MYAPTLAQLLALAAVAFIGTNSLPQPEAEAYQANAVDGGNFRKGQNPWQEGGQSSLASSFIPAQTHAPHATFGSSGNSEAPIYSVGANTQATGGPFVGSATSSVPSSDSTDLSDSKMKVKARQEVSATGGGPGSGPQETGLAGGQSGGFGPGAWGHEFAQKWKGKGKGNGNFGFSTTGVGSPESTGTSTTDNDDDDTDTGTGTGTDDSSALPAESSTSPDSKRRS